MLWVISLVCFVKGFGLGVTAEEGLRYNPELTAIQKIETQHIQLVGAWWVRGAWIVQAFTVGLLFFGLTTRRRLAGRILFSAGIVLAADGIALLLLVVVIHTVR
jgi:hypothetical protein